MLKSKANADDGDAEALDRDLRAALVLEQKGEKAMAGRVYEDVIRSLPGRTLNAVLQAARVLRARRRHGQAAQAFRHALKRDPENLQAGLELGATLCDGGQLARARTVFRQRLSVEPGAIPVMMRLGQVEARLSLPTEGTWLLRALACDVDPLDAHLRLARIRLPGPGYLDVLATAHAILKPRSYVEIGVASGSSLALARHPTRAVGIDPHPRIKRRFSVPAVVYRMKSDEFFNEVDLAEVLGGTPFDLGFIDGLHSFEQTLRDFVNLESRSAPTSVLLLHDCLPLDERTGSWPRTTSFWSGDSWRILPYLMEQRPDLGIHVIPCWPTGLVVVSALDANRRVPPPDARQLDRYRSLSIGAFYRRYVARIPSIRNDAAAHREFFDGLARAVPAGRT